MTKLTAQRMTNELDVALTDGLLIVRGGQQQVRRYYSATQAAVVPRVLVHLNRTTGHVIWDSEPIWPRNTQETDTQSDEFFARWRPLVDQARSRQAKVAGGVGYGGASFINIEDAEPFARWVAAFQRRVFGRWYGATWRELHALFDLRGQPL